MPVFQTIVILAIIVVLLNISEFGSKYVLTRLSLGPKEEFPDIDPDALDRFSSFDSELGWERQPNEARKKDHGHQNPDNPEYDTTITYSTDEYGSRVCPIDRDVSEEKIATYGGSFCFCRDVQNNETFQHYLAKELDTHVSNYGVGNYGLDQSVKRLQRRFNNDPADYVIIAFTSGSVGRVVGVWKHYSEFGNTFATKPRYKHSESDQLIEIPCFVEEKEDLLSIEDHAEFLHKNDYHYENRFLEKRIARPYTVRLLRDKDEFLYAASRVVNFLSKKAQAPTPVRSRTEQLYQKFRLKHKSNHSEYIESISEEFADLYCDILLEFESFARERGSTPVYLPLYSGGHVEYEMKNGPIDEPIISELKRRDSELVVLDDIRDEMVSSVDDLSELYAKSSERPSGHHSPQANKLIAKRLAEFVREHKAE